MRGLLLIPGLFQEARDIIIYFARVMRHGLIPNLHDRGNNTRYNARDATWFFLQAIKDYVNLSPEGEEFLSEEFELHFYNDDKGTHERMQNENQPKHKMTIKELIVHILQSHASGINFKEWNAGPNIDEHMKEPGFNVSIRYDERTGFLMGGNKHNCGTWMDKMGSVGDIKGVPATPRDGAPIELVALLYSTLDWVVSLVKGGYIQEHGVTTGNGAELHFSDWRDKVRSSFERCFWVPIQESEDQSFEIKKDLVSRRGIYKDVFGSEQGYTDYQLRPNVCVAMQYAPDLFDVEHAKTCLDTVERVLMEKGCMGIKTLDPADRNYNGDYKGSDERNGWNYHQGPEWVWPVGHFLRSKLLFWDYPTGNDSRR